MTNRNDGFGISSELTRCRCGIGDSGRSGVSRWGLERVRGGLGSAESCAGNDAEDQRGGDGEEQGCADRDADYGLGGRGAWAVGERALGGDKNEAQVIRRG